LLLFGPIPGPNFAAELMPLAAGRRQRFRAGRGRPDGRFPHCGERATVGWKSALPAAPPVSTWSGQEQRRQRSTENLAVAEICLKTAEIGRFWVSGASDAATLSMRHSAAQRHQTWGQTLASALLTIC